MMVVIGAQTCDSAQASFACKLAHAQYPLVCNYHLVFKTASPNSSRFSRELFNNCISTRNNFDLISNCQMCLFSLKYKTISLLLRVLRILKCLRLTGSRGWGGGDLSPIWMPSPGPFSLYSDLAELGWSLRCTFLKNHPPWLLLPLVQGFTGWTTPFH